MPTDTLQNNVSPDKGLDIMKISMSFVELITCVWTTLSKYPVCAAGLIES